MTCPKSHNKLVEESELVLQCQYGIFCMWLLLLAVWGS